MNSMEFAPKDGTRILLKYTVMHVYSEGWREDGEKWEECFWDAKREWCSSDLVLQQGSWVPWCGNPHVSSTKRISHPLGWLPLPINQ